MSSNDRVVNSPKGYFSRVDTSKPQIGIVKDNRDEEFMGRLKVWIKGSTAPESDPSGWIWVNYGAPFAGATPNESLGRNVQSYDDTQKSYGIWANVPDIGNEVIIMFINGDIRQGYWVACLYHKNMNQMVPGIGEGLSYQQSTEEFAGIENPSIPVSEYNKYSRNTSQRPYYQPLAQGLITQGLIQDDLRGAGTSSARRESPSRVSGWLTPGGNQLILDDGQDSELIRLRTKSGAQILISETFGNIYLISKDGKNWLELTNDGNVDIYGAEEISIRSESNINIRADGDINMEAGGGIKMKAQGESGYKLECPIGNIDQLAVNKFCTLSANNHLECVDTHTEASGEFHVVSDDWFVSSGNNMNMNADNQLRFQSPNEISFTSGNNINFFGDTVNSNSGPGPTPDPAVPADPATPIPTSVKLDKDLTDENQIVDVNLETILSRVPHHEPWPEHAVAVMGVREVVEEGDNPASVGSVSETAAAPLPIVGTPIAGMTPGIYAAKGYNGSEPLYEFLGSTSTLQTPNNYVTSAAGIAFIARFEGFSSNVYLDAANKPTIGYGHLITGNESFDVSKGISREQALEILQEDVKLAEAAVRKNVKVDLTQNQFDALVSFTFNLGPGNLKKSTMLKELNAGNYNQVPNEMMRWVYAGGKRLAGLIRRRREEALVFSTAQS